MTGGSSAPPRRRPAQVAARHREYELSVKVLPMLRDAGIPILAGTDAGYLNSFNYPGQGLHDELAALCRGRA